MKDGIECRRACGGRGPGREDKYLVLVLVILLAAIAGCQVKQNHSPVQKAAATVPETSVGTHTTLMAVRYARGFRLESSESGPLLIICNPNEAGEEIAKYRIIPAATAVNPKQGFTDIVVPLSGLVASSTTHAGFLSAIGSGDRLLGCNNPERLYDSLLYNRFLSGDLVRTGRDLEYNLEFLIATKPGLVLQTGIDGRFKPDSRLAGMGIPIMFVLEWMEPTPLGRAEWIKVFGMITGKAREADSLFNLIEKNYLSLSETGHKALEKVKVLTGNVFKGIWYMPGGRNYMTRFFEDAGMDYAWKNNDQSASLALSFESVVYQLADSPVWINVNVDSITALIAAEARYSVFRAVQDKRVFSVFNRVNSHGGNDFWESAVVRPDKVLADLLAIAHPGLMPGHIWNYYKPLVFN